MEAAYLKNKAQKIVQAQSNSATKPVLNIIRFTPE